MDVIDTIFVKVCGISNVSQLRKKKPNTITQTNVIFTIPHLYHSLYLMKHPMHS
jgi:hypothetical protein